jgi:hypothetical protein
MGAIFEMDEEMIDFRRPFSSFVEEVVAGLPPAGQVRIEALIWVLIRLVYELAQALIGWS